MIKGIDNNGFSEYFLSERENMKDDFLKDAMNFLKSTNTEMNIVLTGYGKHFDTDKDDRNIYTFTLNRNGKIYKSTFGDSIHNTEKGIEPNEYDI